MAFHLLAYQNHTRCQSCNCALNGIRAFLTLIAKFFSMTVIHVFHLSTSTGKLYQDFPFHHTPMSQIRPT
jgi:hypothetical protein